MRTFNLLIAVFLVSFSSYGFAGDWHEATKPTQEEAMREATRLAIKEAKRENTCYKPAWAKQVVKSKKRRCTKVNNGVKCWATSANEYGSCENGKHGWLYANSPAPVWQTPQIPIYPELPKLPDFETSKQ